MIRILGRARKVLVKYEYVDHEYECEYEYKYEYEYMIHDFHEYEYEYEYFKYVLEYTSLRVPSTLAPGMLATIL